MKLLKCAKKKLLQSCFDGVSYRRCVVFGGDFIKGLCDSEGHLTHLDFEGSHGSLIFFVFLHVDGAQGYIP